MNNTLVANIPDDWKLKLVDLDIDFQEGCVVESWMTLLAENSSMSKTTTTFTIECRMTNDFVENMISQPAYLDVYGELRYCMHSKNVQHVVIQTCVQISNVS